MIATAAACTRCSAPHQDSGWIPGLCPACTLPVDQAHRLVARAAFHPTPHIPAPAR